MCQKKTQLSAAHNRPALFKCPKIMLSFLNSYRFVRLLELPFMKGLPDFDVDHCKYRVPYRERTRLWTNLDTWIALGTLTTFTPFTWKTWQPYIKEPLQCNLGNLDDLYLETFGTLREPLQCNLGNLDNVYLETLGTFKQSWSNLGGATLGILRTLT